MKKFILTCATSLLLMATISMAHAVTLSPAQASQFLLSGFTFLSDSKVPYSDYSKYLAKDITSEVNGSPSTTEEFIKHVNYMRSHIVSMKVKLLSVTTAPNQIAAKFIATIATKPDNGGPIQTSVLKFYSFYLLNDQGKIQFFDEVAIPLKTGSNNNLGKQSS